MQATARGAAAPAFALAMFLSAALIFALQPMFSRLTTPMLGGSPSVWNTSMVFFQGALLVGYLYAHLLQRVRDIRVQAITHAAVLAVAFLFLPVRVSELLGAPNSEQPIFWLFGVLTLSIGAPFAAASATAPLLQAWYTQTGRKDAHDPYYLYAASNLGSLLGLLLYPILVEPNLATSEQSIAWTWGYGVAILFIMLCGMLAVWAHGKPQADVAQVADDAPPLTWRNRIYWLGAAAVPSSLLLGVTQHLSTDVASAPFLWVVPLALYLVTFIVAFMRGAEKISPVILVIHPLTLVLLGVMYMARTNWTAALFAHLLCFFISALICHLALARTRPAAKHLTEFYLYVSLGGVVGGALTALLAPVIFNGVYEYPIALAATALFRPRNPAKDKLIDQGVALALGLCTLAMVAPLAAPGVFGPMNAEVESLQMFFAVGAVALAVMIVSLIGRFPEMMDRAGRVLGVSALAFTAATLLLLIHSGPDMALLGGLFGGAGALAAAGLSLKSSQPIGYRIGFAATAVVFAGMMVALAIPSARAAMMTQEGFNIIMADWVKLVLIASSLLLLAFLLHTLTRREEGDDFPLVLALGAALPFVALVLTFTGVEEGMSHNFVRLFGLSIVALALFLNRGRPIVMAAIILGMFAMLMSSNYGGGSHLVRQERSFFGVVKVEDEQYRAPSGQTLTARLMLHGTTIHGAQIQEEQYRRQVLTYYNESTALGAATRKALENAGPNARLGLIGLGTGTTACLTQPTNKLTIFEIDPLVVRLSGPEGDTYSYVRLCQPSARVVIGDARLKMNEEPDGSFDAIVVDAFSSDAIPAHLLTAEAVQMYMRKLSPNGVLILHLSNRNLALIMEAARVAHFLNLPNRWWTSPDNDSTIGGPYGGMAASAMVLTHRDGQAALALFEPHWQEAGNPPGRPWTDDYINLPRSLFDNLNNAEDCFLYPDRMKGICEGK